MSEVSCRSCVLLIDEVKNRGIPERELVRGLPQSPEELARPSNRIPWNDFTVFLENGTRLLGGPESLEALATNYYQRAGGMLGALASRVSSARPLYHLGARWYGPLLYSNTRGTCEDLPDRRLRVTIEILPGYRHSELFFRAMGGAMRGAPALLGQPFADVETEIMPRRGVFTIEPPPYLSVLKRIRRALSWRSALERADRELEVEREELQRGYELTRSAMRQLDEKSREIADERQKRERTEQLLLRAEKLETVGQLTAGIAHDFNNVLSAISAYGEVVMERVGRSDPIAADLEEILAVSARGAAMVRKLLAFSRPQAWTQEPVELNSAIGAMESMLARLIPESIELLISPSPEPVTVIADSGQLEQVIMNLVVNSRDAMPEGGRIAIGISWTPPSEFTPALRARTRAVRYGRIEVRDTGRGMDSRTLSRAFEPFFTTKAGGEGTGLGLATVRRIVSQNGGAVHLESEVGKGTGVVIDLPADSG